MHIAINTTPLESGHRNRGVGQYTKLLIGALQKYENTHSYSFFTRGQKVPKNTDIVHYPYFDPFFLTLPLFKSKPTVVTVHDLITVKYADHFAKGIRGELKWQIQKASLFGVARIITDSNASKADIQEIVGYKEGRIDVVHLAPSPVFRPLQDKVTLERVKKTYNLPEQFVLYVGDVNWNKNVQGLVKAFDMLTKTVFVKRLSLKAVFVGKAFVNTKLQEAREIHQLIKLLNLDTEILRVGFVPDEDLVAFYNLASVYVQPSFAEGFGFPVLEAMTCGCPAVVSRGTSLDEIAGPSIRIDPNDSSSIAEGILRVLNLTHAERENLLAE